MKGAEYGVAKCESEGSSEVFQHMILRNQLLIILAARLRESTPASHYSDLDAPIKAP